MAGAITQSRDGQVLTLAISNEDKLNALDLAMWASLRDQIAACGKDDTLRCVVITGAGVRAFSAGADISEFGAVRATREQVVRFHEDYVGACLDAIAGCPMPVVARIQGACFGGGLEIASVCDIRLADETARFGAPVARLGFPLALGETQALFNLVGPTVAAELLIESRILNAQEAYERRLVTRLSAAGELDADVRGCAEAICRNGAEATRSHKRQLRRLATDRSPVTLAERMEVYSFAETEEYRLGYQKFLGMQKVASRI